MKIGVFDPYLDTLSGGEKYMLSIVSCLSSQHEVFIIWDKEKESWIKQTASKKLGIDLSSVKFYKNIFGKNVSSISRFIESRKFNSIIYLSDGSIPLVGTKLFIHFQFPIEWIDGKSIKTKIKLFFVNKIFCNSHFTKYFIDRKLNIESKVLYPPVIINIQSNIKKENIILHVGRFDVDRTGVNYKKQDVMIEIFKKMADGELKDWKFIIIVGVKDGDENKLDKLKEATKGYQIEVIENPSNKILWEYYKKSKIYWHASGFGEDLEKHPEYAEHFGISTVEAMGAGVVPVVINAGGQKEIVENEVNGFLWNSLEELEQKTLELISNKKLWENMSEAAKKRAKDFAGNRFCKEIENLIKS